MSYGEIKYALNSTVGTDEFEAMTIFRWIENIEMMGAKGYVLRSKEYVNQLLGSELFRKSLAPSILELEDLISIGAHIGKFLSIRAESIIAGLEGKYTIKSVIDDLDVLSALMADRVCGRLLLRSSTACSLIASLDIIKAMFQAKKTLLFEQFIHQDERIIIPKIGALPHSAYTDTNPGAHTLYIGSAFVKYITPGFESYSGNPTAIMTGFVNSPTSVTVWAQVKNEGEAREVYPYRYVTNPAINSSSYTRKYKYHMILM